MDSVGIDAETGELVFDTVDYAVFANTLGAQISYDFNFAQSSAQLYRRDVISFEDTFDFIDRVEYKLSGTLSRRIFQISMRASKAACNRFATVRRSKVTSIR